MSIRQPYNISVPHQVILYMPWPWPLTHLVFTPCQPALIRLTIPPRRIPPHCPYMASSPNWPFCRPCPVTRSDRSSLMNICITAAWHDFWCYRPLSDCRAAGLICIGAEWWRWIACHADCLWSTSLLYYTNRENLFWNSRVSAHPGRDSLVLLSRRSFAELLSVPLSGVNPS